MLTMIASASCAFSTYGAASTLHFWNAISNPDVGNHEYLQFYILGGYRIANTLLGKIAQCFTVVFLPLDWLPSKAREVSLHYYLIHSFENDIWIHVFNSEGIHTNVNTKKHPKFEP